ncbi:phage holin [Listeria innocua]|uniref:phage holin n=1 Tax=Listeria innocua TaxID=1642 RepID=UPI00162A1A6B|nr:phage holin [Listeria innocua]MBC1353884.1 phage holin [Listeria innocua]
MKINWKVRFSKKNLTFIGRFIAAVFIPVIAYMGLTVTDFTSWGSVYAAFLSYVSNPYLLALTLVNAINIIPDPTTKGIGDSQQALNYSKPKGGK